MSAKNVFVIIGYNADNTIQVFGTPSGRTFYGKAVDQAKFVLEKMYPNVRFIKCEITPYIEVAPEGGDGV